MRVVISGSHGLIGQALGVLLKQMGHTVIPLVRRTPHENEIFWDPQKDLIESDKFEGIDVLIHLAGENIASGRWTKARKDRIWRSRTESTRLLSQKISQLKRPPKVFAVASAIGFYGNQGNRLLDEESPPGSGFLASLCREWEAASEEVPKESIRVLKLRFGVVLSQQGGMLAKMIPAFKVGLGGTIGRGYQYISWVDIDDIVEALLFLLEKEELSGSFNIVAPNPVTNKEFTKELGRVLKRPTIVSLPTLMLRLALGEMADEMLLASTRAIPSRLLSAGYIFRYPILKQSLKHHLK